MGHFKTLVTILLVSATSSLAHPDVFKILPMPSESTTPTELNPLTNVSEPALHQSHYELEKSLHDKILNDQYLKLIRPEGEDGITHVRVNAYVRDIQLNQINPEAFRWTVDLTFRQMWNDKRLAFDEDKKHPDYKYFPLNKPKNIWTPDLFFRENVKADFHYVTTPNVLLWIYPNGDVLYSMRVTVELRCYKSSSPNASQKVLNCPMSFASYAHTDKEVDITWDKATDKPVFFVKDRLHIAGYDLEEVTTEESTTSSTIVGNFSKIIANFKFVPEEH